MSRVYKKYYSFLKALAGEVGLLEIYEFSSFEIEETHPLRTL